MGRVFQAEQISLGKMVAIKVMRSELMSEPNLIQRFELEARAASALNHPNLIQILDFGRDRSFLFMCAAFEAPPAPVPRPPSFAGKARG
jgi:serine/threonine protein kinase